MNNRSLLAGAAVGAAVAYMLDPDRGARRRAVVRDKIVRGANLTGRALDATARDMANRSRGIASAARTRWSGERVDDWRLVERVRAKLGRVSSHPRAIDVDARDGEVTLRGPILADEVDDVLGMAASIPGVCTLVNELEPHETADHIPSLQGEGHVAGPTLDVLQRNWAPATRALVAAAALAGGVAAVAYARR
jgi:gas vesicle protein